MITFGLIGKSLTHSFSKQYFSKKFKKLNLSAIQYLNFELQQVEELFDYINQHNVLGLNVTIPFKESVIPLLDEVDEVAQQIGAVNTIKIEKKSGKNYLKGFNTDAFGFHQSIKPFLRSHHERALILGTGGAAKAVAYVLNQYNIIVNYVSRQPTYGNIINWEEVNELVLKHHFLIINTTPLGMYPSVYDKPNIPYQYIGSSHLLIDLIYNPSKTKFLASGEEQGATIINGLTMLEQQAERSWEIWNDNRSI